MFYNVNTNVLKENITVWIIEHFIVTSEYDDIRCQYYPLLALTDFNQF